MTGDRTRPIRPRRPFEPTRPAPDRSSALPEWMRNPQPAGLDLGPRTGAAGWLQRRWWVWQERKRLDQRYPISFKVIAFFASWFLALALLLGAYALYLLA
jgi:hypothetical protein